MRYTGGKARISKDIARVLNSNLKENQTFVDLFCGSCNVITKIDSNRLRIANDKHKYLMEMWKALQLGWVPPTTVTEEMFYGVRDGSIEVEPCLKGFIGFGCSYSGRWFGCYARSSDGRNYADEAKRSLEKKIRELKNVKFYNLDYSQVDIPLGSMVYCDIPYENKYSYDKKEVGVFNHDEFYKWVEKNRNNYDIYISEYKENIREGFEVVWEKQSKTGFKGKNGKALNTNEILIKPI